MAGGVAVALLLGAALFQLALAAGAPFGEATMGGRARTTMGVLAPAYRVAATINAVVLVVAAWILGVRAGLVFTGALSDTFVRSATWLIAGFMLLNTVGNISGRHPVERWVMGPVALVVAVLALLLALNG